MWGNGFFRRVGDFFFPPSLFFFFLCEKNLTQLLFFEYIIIEFLVEISLSFFSFFLKNILGCLAMDLSLSSL